MNYHDALLVATMGPTQPSTIDVSVLVPVLNEGATIRDATKAMAAQQVAGNVEFLFADGGSTDDTRAQLEQLASGDPRIKVLDNPRRGTASGLNACLAVARGAYVARMDGHSLYPPRYLQAGIERLRDGDAAWAAGPQVPQGNGRVSEAVAAALSTWLGRGASRRWGERDGHNGGEHDLDTGVFCGVWRREDVLAHGGWDEGWPRNQDSELAARFLAAGQRIVSVPEMAALYIPRDSIASLWRQYRGYGVYRAKTARRHPSSLRRSAVLPPLLVLDVGAALAAPRMLRAGARLGVVAYLAAVAAATAGSAADGQRADPLVAAMLATMHMAHGVGFLEGSLRWGVPWQALRALASSATGVAEATPYRGPIYAPSLHTDRGD